MTNVKLLPYLGPGIAAMGVVAAGYGLAFALAAKKSAAPAKPVSWRAFEPKLAFGGRRFAVRVCPSHLGMILALWLPWLYLL